MKQDADWVKISGLFDPTLLFKLTEKFVLKQSNNQYKTAVLIDEQLSILSFRQDDQVGNATYYDWFTTRVEVACQAGVCYHSPDLLGDKFAQLNMAAYDTLLPAEMKTVVDVVKQEYLVYLFIINGNAKMHSLLKKDVANNYSKGNTDAYPKDIHKVLTLMNEYKLLKLDAQVVPAQGTAFVTGGQGGKGRKGAKYLQDAEWNALSPETKSKIIEACKKGAKGGEDDDDKSSSSAKLAKTIKSLSKTIRLLERDNKKLGRSVSALQKCNKDDDDDDNDLSISTVEGSSYFQDALEMLKEHHPRIVLALRHRKFMELGLRNVLLLDNQSTFDLCCNKKFASKIIMAENALQKTSNGGGLKITKKCKIPGYKYLVWYSKKAIANIICLKNLIKFYRVTYDRKVDTTFVVHCSAFGLPNMLFEMYPCRLHVYYPKNMGDFVFVQTVEDSMKFFSKQQIAGAIRAQDLIEKMIYPSTADFRVIVSAGGISGCKVTPDNVKATEVIWGKSVLKMKGNTVRRNGKRVAQNIIKVPKELIKLQQDVELAIDCFFVNKHIFFTTYSTKICFTMVMHLGFRTKAFIWKALHATYKMYLLQYPSPLCRLTWVVTHVIGLHIKLTILGEYDVASMTILGMLISNIVLTVDTRAH
jgi:hypothetical protein